jgi:hypothetical protein
MPPTRPTGEVTVDIEAVARLAVGEPVSGVVRAVSRYATSHRTSEIDVLRPDGTVVELLFKDLAPGALLPQATGRRPGFLDDPAREVEVYRDILATAGLGTPRCLAAGDAPDHPWLLLERVAGTVLWQVGDLGVWCDVARWAARLHDVPLDLTATPRLLGYDRSFFSRWPRRARQFQSTGDPVARARLDRVLRRYDEVIEALVALPPRFVHGELYASNVMVDPSLPRVCAVDWEMAGAGPGVLDLAALSAGGWGDVQRASIVAAYHQALPTQGYPLDELVTDVRRCRLHLCLQWLGWSPGWQAPATQRQDWLGVALRCAEELGL